MSTFFFSFFFWLKCCCLTYCKSSRTWRKVPRPQPRAFLVSHREEGLISRSASGGPITLENNGNFLYLPIFELFKLSLKSHFNDLIDGLDLSIALIVEGCQEAFVVVPFAKSYILVLSNYRALSGTKEWGTSNLCMMNFSMKVIQFIG